MKKSIFPILILFFISHMVFAQNATVEGYAFETDNRGYLREVQITVYSSINAIKAETVTDKDGKFQVELPLGEKYRIKARKDIFEDKEVFIEADELSAEKTHYVKLEMKRKPGYLFDVTLAESARSGDGSKMALDSTLIEIFNNTTKKEELVLKNHPHPNFQYTFEQGNHYTIMIRKKGYFTKRMEARVNVEGCILCFEGMGKVQPNVSDNLTEGNKMGSLLANVELDRVNMNRSIQIENIYYDYNKWDIRPDAALELNKVIAMMSDNPSFIIELGSHTDARGKDAYNMELSQKRARSAVAYVMREGGIPPTRIKAQGYGETQIMNRCTNGVNCSDAEHEKNRRTMIRVIGFTEKDPYDDKSLMQIILGESIESFTWDDTEVIQVGEDGKLPDAIEKEIQIQNEKPITEQNVMPVPDEAPITSQPTTRTETVVEEVVEEVITSRPSTSGAFGEDVEAEVPEIKEEDIPNAEFEDHRATGEMAEGTPPPPPPKKNIADNYTTKVGPKSLASDYTGYMVEFFNSGIELSSDHSIFKQYGQVKMEQKENGEFAYLLGGFSSEKEASSYMKTIITPRFPAAKVIQYDNGKRVE